MNITDCDLIKISSLIIAVMAFIITVWQFFVSKQHIRMNIYYKVIERLEDMRDQRHRVYELKDVDYKTWKPENILDVEKVCREFDIVGILYKQKLVPKSLLIRFYSYPISKCWDICKDYIISIREKRDQKSHMGAFQDLAEKCKKWQT